MAPSQHRGHVAAVTSAEHANAVGIAERILCQRAVKNGEHIFNIGVTPTSARCNRVFASKNCLAPCLFAAARAAGVAHEHHETSRCLHLCFVEERFAVLRVRAAVHVEQHRVFFLRVEADWLHDPCVDVCWAAGVRGSAGNREMLPCLWGNFSERVGAMVAELTFCAIDDGEDFGHLVHCAGNKSDGV